MEKWTLFRFISIMRLLRYLHAYRKKNKTIFETRVGQRCYPTKVKHWKIWKYIRKKEQNCMFVKPNKTRRCRLWNLKCGDWRWTNFTISGAWLLKKTCLSIDISVVLESHNIPVETDKKVTLFYYLHFSLQKLLWSHCVWKKPMPISIKAIFSESVLL